MYLDCRKLILFFYFVFCLVLDRVFLCSSVRSLMLGLQACATMSMCMWSSIWMFLCVYVLSASSVLGLKAYISWQPPPPNISSCLLGKHFPIDIYPGILTTCLWKQISFVFFLSEKCVIMHGMLKQMETHIWAGELV